MISPTPPRAIPGLSARLSRVLQLIGSGPYLADIGSDHALLPLAWLQCHPQSRAVAVDLRPSPLQMAARNQGQSPAGDRLELRLGDGLSVFSQDLPDVVTICGISGRGILDILRHDPQQRRNCIPRFILAPNDRDFLLRAALPELGLRLIDEDALWERGQYFPLLILSSQPPTPNENAPLLESLPLGPEGQSLHPPRPASSLAPKAIEPQLAERFGPFLLARRDPSLLAQLQKQYQRLKNLLDRGVSTHTTPQISRELQWVEAALKIYPPETKSR